MPKDSPTQTITPSSAPVRAGQIREQRVIDPDTGDVQTIKVRILKVRKRRGKT